MNKRIRKQLAKCKSRIKYRLRDRKWPEQGEPMFRAGNLHYEMSDRDRGLSYGGIGAMHLLAGRTGLIDAINRNVHVLKRHLPYHESDHVLNIAYNILTGGTCLEDIELRRSDEVVLDALGAERIPDPTTEGDFCRRFRTSDVEALIQAINEVRLNIWSLQEESFFDEAIIEADGTLASTTGECKEGMDISYKGEWGYHPLVISLANTNEPLYLVNRSGNRPSHEGASQRLDQSIELCERAGFGKILLRGDTDFTQTEHLDRWDKDGVSFIFGIDARANLTERAEELPEALWRPLVRPAKYKVRTEPRVRPVNVKERIVRERQYKNIRLVSEHAAEFDYSPGKCSNTYRVVVLRKNLSVERGERVLFDDVRYFFYITNDRKSSPARIVASANDRCNQENLNEQLANGVKAMRMPVDNLTSNWAYMVMASLAWTLKAWFALVLPAKGRWKDKHRAEKECVLRMEFKTFLNAFMRLPCRVIRSSRRIVFRLLSWNPRLNVFFRAVDSMRYPLRC